MPETSISKTIVKIGCAAGGAALTSSIGLPWLGAMAGVCLPDVLSETLGLLVIDEKDDKDNKEKKNILDKLLREPLSSLVSEFAGSRIDDFFKSHFERKESELNFDLPRSIVKVWEEALSNLLIKQRDISILGINSDHEFEKNRKELLIFWLQKLRKAQADNSLLTNLFDEKPDYFLNIEKGKESFIEALPNEEQVKNFFWNRIENSFTKWAKEENRFLKSSQNSINQVLRDELKKELFQNFSTKLKDKLKDNEKSWKSFEFTASLQAVSMLQSLSLSINKITDDTNNIKKDVEELAHVLPLIMRGILNRFDALEDSHKAHLRSNQSINELLINFKDDVDKKFNEMSKQLASLPDQVAELIIKKLFSVNHSPIQLPENIQSLIENELKVWKTILEITLKKEIPKQLRKVKDDESYLNYLLDQDPSFKIIMRENEKNYRSEIEKNIKSKYLISHFSKKEELFNHFKTAAPITIWFPPVALGVSAIFFYLRDIAKCNIDIRFSVPHSLAIIEEIENISENSSDILIPPNAIVVADSTSSNLYKNRHIGYEWKKLMPCSEQRILAPNTNKKGIDAGEYYFPMRDKIISSPRAAMKRLEDIKKNPIKRNTHPKNTESNRLTEVLEHGDPESRAILWLPHSAVYEFLGLGRAILNESGENWNELWYSTFLYFEKSFCADKNSTYLELAIIEAWKTLKLHETILNATIYCMVKDTDYISNLLEYCGLDDPTYLKKMDQIIIDPS